MTTLTVAGWRYPDEAASVDAFARAHDALDEVSVWRTTTDEHDAWYLLVCYRQPNEAVEAFDCAVEPIGPSPI